MLLKWIILLTESCHCVPYILKNKNKGKPRPILMIMLLTYIVIENTPVSIKNLIEI